MDSAYISAPAPTAAEVRALMDADGPDWMKAFARAARADLGGMKLP